MEALLGVKIARVSLTYFASVMLSYLDGMAAQMGRIQSPVTSTEPSTGSRLYIRCPGANDLLGVQSTQFKGKFYKDRPARFRKAASV